MFWAKIKDWFKTGIVTFIPPIAFVLIVVWICKFLVKYTRLIVWWITGKNIDEIMAMPNFVITIIAVVSTLLLILLIGLLVNSKHIGTKLKKWLSPIILKTPLLSSLTKITTQVAATLDWENSFKKVVVVKFPSEDFQSIWFITWNNTKSFKENSKENDLLTVFIPTTPNPTSWYTVVMKKEKMREINMSVSEALSFLVSMGTAWGTSEIISRTSKED